MAVGKGPGPPKAPKVDLDDLVRRWEADKKSRLFLQLADEYRRQDQVDAAISVLKEGLKVHATFAPAHVALARCLMAKGQPAQAQAELEPIHKRSPDNMMAGKLLAEVLAERGEGRRALEVLKSLRPFAIDDPEVEQRIAALESRMSTPTARTTHSGDTAEFATGEFASSTASLGGAAAPVAPPRAAALPDETAIAAAAPVEMPRPAPDASEEDVFGAADDDGAAAGSEDADTGAADDDADVIVLADDEHGDDVLDDVVLPPMPKPAQPSQDLLGAPLVAARGVGHEDEFTSVTLAELHDAQGAVEEAIAIYEALLAKKPGDAFLRKALDRCRAKLAGTDTATAVMEVVAAPTPSITRPRWEPVRARTGASAETGPETEAEPPVAPAEAVRPPAPPMAPVVPAALPLPARAAEPSRPAARRGGAGPSPANLRETARQLRLWLDAVAAVRQ